jgi:hypothetical protein
MAPAARRAMSAESPVTVGAARLGAGVAAKVVAGFA